MTTIIRSVKDPIAINGLREDNIDVVNEDITILIFLSPQAHQFGLSWFLQLGRQISYFSIIVCWPRLERSRLSIILLPIFSACFATMNSFASWQHNDIPLFTLEVRCTRRRMSEWWTGEGVSFFLCMGPKGTWRVKILSNSSSQGRFKLPHFSSTQ